MIAFDTNAIVRVLTEDDPAQAKKVRRIIQAASSTKQNITKPKNSSVSTKSFRSVSLIS